jgi:hypothetical protein
VKDTIERQSQRDGSLPNYQPLTSPPASPNTPSYASTPPKASPSSSDNSSDDSEGGEKRQRIGGLARGQAVAEASREQPDQEGYHSVEGA